MAERQSRGRQKIPIRLIANQDDLYATFSKRRLGLYKKASELCTLCGVDIGIIIFSPTGNPFSFFHPSMESVIDRHRNHNQQISDFARIVDAHTRGRIENLNKRLDEMLDLKEEAKKRENQLDEVDKTREKWWWEEFAVESLDKEQVKEWRAWFENFNARVINRMKELNNEGSSSTASFQILQNAPNMPGASLDQGAAGPSIFGHNYVPPRPNYTHSSGGIVGGGYNYPVVDGIEEVVPRHFHFPPPSSGEASTRHCSIPPPTSHNPFSSQYLDVPHRPLAQNPSVGGQAASPSSQYIFGPQYPPIHDPFFGQAVPTLYLLPRPPSKSTDPSPGDGGTREVGPSRYYVPTQGHNPSIGGGGGGGTDEAGPSHHGGDKNP
ncbi:hypothetical protein BUALT_Bualt01G0158900 [Buddleja alternifolia]|uniref:MADS-box domain-containing protein n=1 Tax=Buddleja alternifolia TaxID=168488 RepID=A0AAV6YBQ7_9LAMI|nr:hypothetical protein BUALT_Bualt01G0158900 [Buddleja alternifolia]